MKMSVDFSTASRAEFLKVCFSMAGNINPSEKNGFIIHIYGGDNNCKSLIADGMITYWRDNCLNNDVPKKRMMQFEEYSGQGRWETCPKFIISNGKLAKVAFIGSIEQVEELKIDGMPNVVFLSCYEREEGVNSDIDICLTQNRYAESGKEQEIVHSWRIRSDQSFDI